MFTHGSIIVLSSTSGKVTKEILRTWAKEVLFKMRIRNGITLLLDPYSLHLDEDNLNTFRPNNFRYEIEFIPPGTPNKLQPLDKEPNRTMKEMMRNFTEGFQFDDPRITNRIRVSCRDAIDIMQVLLLNQIDSPRFKSWIAHSWKSCGYATEAIPFLSPTKYCFELNVYRNNCVLCDQNSFQSSFIRCGWCKNHFCEYHFFFHGEIHFCQNFIE